MQTPHVSLLHRSTRTLSLILCLVALSACVTAGPLRTEKGSCAFDCGNKSILDFGPSARIAIVEFDDQGLMLKRDQFTAAVKAAKQQATSETVYVVYAHGWHHTAKASDSDLAGFRDYLQDLSRLLPQRQVMGFYVGWRGESVKIPLLNALTFWERKNTSHAVGRGSIIELLVALDQIAQSGANSDAHRLILMGHSFGSSVLLTRLGGILAERFVDSVDRPDTISGFADLIVLTNPAIEASYFAPLKVLELARYTREKEQQLGFLQPPRLVLLTSESDWATHYAFPLGRTISTLFDRHRETFHLDVDDRADIATRMALSEAELSRSAIGHYAPFITHRLSFDRAPPKPQTDGNSKRDCVLGLELSPAKTLTASRSLPGWSHPFSDIGLRMTHLKEGTPIRGLESAMGSPPTTPYWNVSVDPQAMDGHGDNWRPGVHCAMLHLVFDSVASARSRRANSR